MVLAVAGILIACWYVGRDDANDPFRAEQAWLYVSIVVGAYLVSRGWRSPAAASSTGTSATAPADSSGPYAGR